MTAPRENVRTKEIRQFAEKIVVNVGVGRASSQPNFAEKTLPQVMRDVALLSGQQPHTRAAKKSIAGFKSREGQTVGLRVTLRGRKMVDFFARLITIVLPRVRDFNGLALSSIDAKGALNIGFRDQYVFPEVNSEESLTSFSLGVNIVPRRRDRESAVAEYRRLGMPLKNEK